MKSIEVKDLNLTFGKTEVLKKLNLSVDEGEFLVLLGPSGCGKSTLLNCLAGLLDVTGGQIFINEKNVTWAEPKDRGIGMVFQSYALYPQMSVLGNLTFGLRNQKLPKEEIQRRVDHSVEILQIGNLLHRKPSALSGGQRQRVAIGRALVREANVFLFDEPLSNLDAKLRAELRVELKRLHERLGNTMVYVTHDQIEALTLADRIAIMRGGIIQQLDKPQEIYNKPNNLFVAGFIGSPSMNFFDAELSNNGASISFGEHTIDVARYESDQLKDGPVTFGFRPEYTKVTLEKPEGSSFKATIELDEPMGSDTLLWLRAGELAFSVRVSSDNAIEKGNDVYVSIKMAKASLFDKQTEMRL